VTDQTASRWRELYMAALFEIDDQHVLERIEAAERALALRARELFEIRADGIEEGHALHDAGYALRALRGCVALRLPPTMSQIDVSPKPAERAS